MFKIPWGQAGRMAHGILWPDISRGCKASPLKRLCTVKDTGDYKARWGVLGNLDSFEGDSIQESTVVIMLCLLFLDYDVVFLLLSVLLVLCMELSRENIFSSWPRCLWWIGSSSSDFMAWLHVVHYLYGATDRLRLRPGDHTCHGHGWRLRLIFLSGKENWVQL